MKTSTKLVLAAAVVSVAAVPVYAQMRRNIRIVGSSTVYPFSKAVAERFARTNPGVPAPIVESTGTGGGMKLFCAGVGAKHPDITNASRRMKASEFRSCKANGVSEITEIAVGLDGLAVATGEKSFAFKLTTRELYQALAAEPFGKAGKPMTWKSINANFPATPIRIYGPPSTSGTRDSLHELIMKAGCNTQPAMAAMAKTNAARHEQICTRIRTDGVFVEQGENDNLIVQKLAANPNTLGIMGYSYVEENPGRLNPVPINGVMPSVASIQSGKYPGSRPLYFYVKNAHAAAIPGLKAYAAEFVRESTMGPSGYLAKVGLVSAAQGSRSRSQGLATTLTPMTGAGLK